MCEGSRIMVAPAGSLAPVVHLVEPTEKFAPRVQNDLEKEEET